MPSPQEILNDENYINANPATKQAIFDKHVASSPEYANANDPTKEAIRNRFGVEAAAKPERKAMQGMEKGPDTLRRGADKATSMLFGEGVPDNISGLDRLKRIGYAGVAGMGTGGAIGATLGAIGGPAAPATVPAGAATGAVVGGVGGVLAEAGEQASQYLGGGRTTQVATGMVAGGLGELTAAVAGKIAKATLHPGKALRDIYEYIRPHQEGDVSVTEHRALETEKARMAAHMGPEGTQALSTVGQAVQRGVGLEADAVIKQGNVDAGEAAKRSAERALRLRTARAKAKATEAVTLREARDAHDKALLEKSKLITDDVDATSQHQVGSDIRNAVHAENDPQVKKAQEAFGKETDAAWKAAQFRDKHGDYFYKSKDGIRVVDMLEGMKTKVQGNRKLEKAYEDVIKTLKGTRPIYDVVPPSGGGGAYGMTILGFEDRGGAAAGIDGLVRELNDRGFGKEVKSSVDALTADQAKQISHLIKHGTPDITSDAGRGFYDWMGKDFKAAKAKYRQFKESQAPYETSRGKAALSGEADKAGEIIGGKDPELLVGRFLGTESGLKEFSAMVPDYATRSKIAAQHVKNEIVNMNAADIHTWASDKQNGHLLREFPEISDWVINPKLNKLAAAEQKISAAKERVNFASSTEGRKVSTGVDARAKKEADEAIKEIAAIKKAAADKAAGMRHEVDKNPHDVIIDIFKGKNSAAELKAKAHHINNDPEARRQFPLAIAQHISSLRPSRPHEPGGMLHELDHLMPALEGSGLMTTEEAAKLRSDITRIIEAGRSVPSKDLGKTVGKMISDGFSKSKLAGRAWRAHMSGVYMEGNEEGSQE